MSNFDFKGRHVRILINKDKCIDCNACRDACPLVRFGGFESLENQYAGYICLQCGGCVAACSQEAISIEGLPPGIPAGKMPSGDEVLNLIKSRRSVRKFREKKVSEKDWGKLFEAVKYSPVGHNSQYVDLVIIESQDVLESLSKIGMDFWSNTTSLINKPVLGYVFKKMLGPHAYSVFSKLAHLSHKQKESFEKGLDPILFNAPAVMLFLAPQDEMMSQAEANMAAQTVALYAPALGLGTCYSGIIMALFSSGNEEVRKLIRIPKGYNVYSALIVGHPKHANRYIPHREERNVYRM